MAWLFGIMLFCAYGASAYWSSGARNKSIEQFAKVQQHQALADGAAASSLDPLASAPGNDTDNDTDIDMSAWSAKRIASYLDPAQSPETPEAVLRIPGIGLTVPVFADTSEANLNRGAGRIAGTPRFGESGNTGIAAHRDGFFRALRQVRRGDAVHLDLPYGTRTYQVVSIRIVDPSDISVLNDSPEPTLTLVTCYPFYFVGPAPKRFIVRARRA